MATLRQIHDADIAPVTAIYNDYIAHTAITFEVDPITATEMAQRVQHKLLHHDWLVVETAAGAIAGYGYYGAYHTRAAYHHTVEFSIYLAPSFQGQGYGTQLYQGLMASAQAKGFRELIGIIALPNPGSLALHRKLGFHEVGILTRVGYKFGQYIDVAIWQRALGPGDREVG
jgi:phosphinothricin acetyltransferase